MSRAVRSVGGLAMIAGVAVLVACEGPSSPIDPVIPPHGVVQALECRVHVASGSFECAPQQTSGGGAAWDIIGGQGTNVELKSGPFRLDEGLMTGPVTIFNLMSDAMATVDGANPTPEGVRVFFHIAPTNGVEVVDADGFDTFTGTAQPYYEYSGPSGHLGNDGILSPREITGEKLWAFALNGAAEFEFAVFISTERATPAVTRSVAYEGLLERSVPIPMEFRQDDVTVDPTTVVWDVVPAAAGGWNGAGVLVPAEAGALTVIAIHDGSRFPVELDIAVPPMIVFDMSVGGNRDIYSAYLDGQELTRLTTAPTSDLDPAGSAAGVVFTSYRDGNAELYSVDFDGMQTRLTNTAAGELQAALSPVDGSIAYARSDNNDIKLWIADADGSGAARAAPAFGALGTIDGSPTWSPDGQRIAFMSTAAGNADIHILEVLTGNVQRVVGTASAEVEPAWRGDSIVFAAASGGATNLQILTVLTGDVTPLTTGAGSRGAPAWLPDGRIVYVEWVGSQSTMRWLDPENPAVSYEVPTPAATVGNPSALPIH